MNKAQRLFKKWKYYNLPENNTTKEYKEYRESTNKLMFYLMALANQGRLYTKQNNGCIENIKLNQKEGFAINLNGKVYIQE